jgi:hypothetical protein
MEKVCKIGGKTQEENARNSVNRAEMLDEKWSGHAQTP